MGEKTHAPLIQCPVPPAPIAECLSGKFSNWFCWECLSPTPKQKKASLQPYYLSRLSHCLQQPFLPKTAGMLSQRLQQECRWLWVGILWTVMQNFSHAFWASPKYLPKRQEKRHVELQCAGKWSWARKKKEKQPKNRGRCLAICQMNIQHKKPLSPTLLWMW